MADRKEREPSPTDEDQAPAAQPAGAPSGPSFDEQLEAALGRLADSGKLIGASPSQREPEPPPAPAPSGNGPDLEGMITRVLERREAESKDRQQREGLEARVAQLQERLEGQGRRQRRWYEPWSWSGD